MQCPSCTATLQTRNLAQQGLMKADHCPACRGYWLDLATLENSLSGVWSDLDDMQVTVAETFSDYLCPHCRARLVNVNPLDHLELRIDRCPSCHGIWLDKGELERLGSVLTEQAEEHGTLTERPPGWSALKWIAYRVAQNLMQLPRDTIV